MRILFTSTPGLGHVNPLLPLMRAARAAGDELLVSIGAKAIPHVERFGFSAVATDVPSKDEFAQVFAQAPSERADAYIYAHVIGRLRTRLLWPARCPICGGSLPTW